jgi:opacity protein-like surface antigen
MKKNLLMLICGLILIPGYLGAEVKQGSHLLSFNGGLVFPSLKTNVSQPGSDSINVENGGVGPSFGGTYLYQLSQYLGLGADVNYNLITEKKMERFPSERRNTNSQAKVFTFEPILKVSLFPDSKWHPVAQAGFGLAMVNESGTYENLSNKRNHTVYDISGTGFTASLGGGLDYDLSDSWIVGMKLKWHYVAVDKRADQKSSDGFIYSNKIQRGSIINLMFSIGYKFGGK